VPPFTTPPRRTALVLLVALTTVAFGAHDADAASRLLWTDFSDDTIGRAALDGTAIDPAFLAGASSPSAVVVRGRYVYWTNATGGGTIGRAGLDGSGINQSFVTGIVGSPFGLAVDDTHVYWTIPFTNRIGRANHDGSGVTQILLGTGAGVTTPTGIAINRTHLYWANASSNSIGRANLDGTGVVANFIDTGAPVSGSFALAVDESHIYWTNDDTDSISRAELDGSQVNLAFVPAAPTMRGLAVGAGGIYWGDNSGGRVGRADIDGSDVDPSLVTGLTDVGGVGLAVDGAAFSPAGADLGGMPVDAGLSPAADLTLRNTGNTTLDLNAATLTGPQAASFAVVNDGCGGRPLDVATSCTVRVAFQPTAEGPASATLGVGGTTLDAPVTASLAGTGVADTSPPGAEPGPAPAPTTPQSARIAIGATAAQQRRALARAVVTVRVPGPGRLTGGARLRVGRRSVPIRVIASTARRTGALRLTLALPAAARAEIARRGRVAARLRLGLGRAGVRVATGERTIRIAAPASRVLAGQWLGRLLGPRRTPPRLTARGRGAVRVVNRAGRWSAVVVR
jgi:hypothetical protein